MFDYLVIGGGIVGVATAWQLQQRNPDSRILLIEKEAALAQHQTGRNSGVIHAGVYYQPGSLKAQFCKQGLADTVDFCQRHELPFLQCGKLLVATNSIELARMSELKQRCQQNGIQVSQLSQTELRETEPNISGEGALLVESTGIVDYSLVCKTLAEQFVAAGGQVQLQAAVTGILETDKDIVVQTTQGDFHARFMVACAGLMADRLADMQGLADDFRIIPFRGEYFQLPKQKGGLVKHLIYPIPDPAMPFLGVHLTRMIDGSITVGPNAVLGWRREGYNRLNFDAKDSWQIINFPGFWRLTVEHWRSGIKELGNSLLKRRYLAEVQKYCPQLSLDDLQSYPAGVRAQAVMSNGALVHDFLFRKTARSLHVCNAPSPAATSALPISRHICDQVKQLNLA